MVSFTCTGSRPHDLKGSMALERVAYVPLQQYMVYRLGVNGSLRPGGRYEHRQWVGCSWRASRSLHKALCSTNIAKTSDNSTTIHLLALPNTHVPIP